MFAQKKFLRVMIDRFGIQRFLRSISGTGTDRHRTATVGTGDYQYWHRHQTAPTGPDQTGPAQDRPGLYYDVFDENFLNIIPFWAI